MWFTRLQLSLLFFILALPLTAANAQFPIDLDGMGAYQPELTFSPITPNPGEPVTVSIGNFVNSLQGSDIRWTVDGVAFETGRNQSSIIIPAGSVNDPVSINARLETLTGQTIDVSGVLIARYVDIIVEPQTHVPTFYTGRPLPSTSSQINVTALINGAVRDEYVYSWRLDDQAIGDFNGRGQYTTQFEMPLDTRPVLTLDVFTLEGQLFARKLIALTNTQPRLRFYEVHSLYGLSENSFDSVIMAGNNVTVRAVPYHLDSRVYNQAPNTSWEIDRRVVTGGGNPYELTLNRVESGGRSTLSFQVQSTTALLQGVSDSIAIFY